MHPWNLNYAETFEMLWISEAHREFLKCIENFDGSEGAPRISDMHWKISACTMPNSKIYNIDFPTIP